MRKVAEPGTYLLVIQLERDAVLTVGRLGRLALAAGGYLYVGSALGGLMGRLRRHLRAEKRHHWHIDYLLTVAAVREVWYKASAERSECRWAQILSELDLFERGPARFGASDCTCGTHLFRCRQESRLDVVRAQIPGLQTLELAGLRHLDLGARASLSRDGAPVGGPEGS